MRLLKIKRPGEFSLVQVATHNTVSYAILSHTWTHGQEVTYRDLIDGTGQNKTGYDKVKFCGEQAAKDGLQYFWVDTCCIDKSDSTELTTAINSMFRWYQNAKKCYVYLADISSPSCNTDAWAKQSTLEAALQISKWFTRGWTLQELIAPAVVEFFSKEGKLLGDKKSLEKLIYKITKIPIQALRGSPFSDFSIAERIQWSFTRHTTEEEDMVYCLLGLCEVSMPLIYGEGKEAALKRLQMTVKEFSKYSSEPGNMKGRLAPFIVPFDRNPNFTGRTFQLAQLEGKLFKEGQTAKLAVTGLGGIGKTQLVLELVYQIRDKYQNYTIIWIPAANLESLQQVYLYVARQLGIESCQKDKADVKELVRSHLNTESAGQWLMVFDNADDINMWLTEAGPEPGSCRLIDCLPKSKKGYIVFISRDRKTAVKLAYQNVIEVPEMPEDIATQLLQKYLINTSLVKSWSDTRKILQRLTYLPLAIIQAAAYINENGIRFADYVLLLEAQEEEVIELLSEEFEDEWRYHNLKNPVATTWLISFEQIRHRDPLAADYLSFMCCIDPKDIPQSILPPGPSRKKEIEAIGTLSAYSFIKRRPADLAIDLHRLVHLATRNWLRKEKLLIQSIESVILRLEEVFPNENHNNRSVWRKYLPHARCVLESDLVDKNLLSRIKLMWKYGMCLYEDGRWNEAEAAIAEIVEIERRDLGTDHPSTLTSMASLGLIYRNQGRWAEAEKLFIQVLETRKTMLGVDYPSMLSSIANLATTYRRQGRLKEAEELEIQVQETSKMKLGADHLHTLNSIANLAATYRMQGRYDEAEVLCAQVLEMRKTKLGTDHPLTLSSIVNLAATYRMQGRYDEAEVLCAQVLEMRKTKLGTDHPLTLSSIANLAATYRKQGRWAEAEELFVQVIEERMRKFGKDHPFTLASMSNLAMTYKNQDRLNEAEELEMQVLKARKTNFGAEHPDTLLSMSNLAITYRKKGQLDMAEELEVQALEARKIKLGIDHPHTLDSISNLAAIYSSQGRWNKAEELDILLERKGRSSECTIYSN